MNTVEYIVDMLIIFQRAQVCTMSDKGNSDEILAIVRECYLLRGQNNDLLKENRAILLQNNLLLKEANRILQ